MPRGIPLILETQGECEGTQAVWTPQKAYDQSYFVGRKWLLSPPYEMRKGQHSV